MIRAEILINNKAWKKYISNPSFYLKNRLKKAEKKITIFQTSKLSFTLLLSGHSEIKRLNKKFRKKNKATDILSFPFHEKKSLYKLIKKNNNNNIYLGDIIINLNKIIKNRKENDVLSFFDEIWIHGLVHLLGHRHESNKDFAVMQKLENKIIKSIQ
tara:strand:+ start:2355 stop:2825 length:471 start_codon:yes stop_codon:yes gene_type:complete